MSLNRKKGLTRKDKLENKTRMERRARLKPMSDKRRAELPDDDVIRQQVFARAGYKCQIKPLLAGTRWVKCWGILTMHHLKKDGQCGETSLDNCIAACAGHNQWVENEPRLARELGLVR